MRNATLWGALLLLFFSRVAGRAFPGLHSLRPVLRSQSHKFKNGFLAVISSGVEDEASAPPEPDWARIHLLCRNSSLTYFTASEILEFYRLNLGMPSGGAVVELTELYSGNNLLLNNATVASWRGGGLVVVDSPSAMCKMIVHRRDDDDGHGGSIVRLVVAFQGTANAEVL